MCMYPPTMINERSSLFRRPHHHYDRFYHNNPNPKLSPKHHTAMDFEHAGEPSSMLFFQPPYPQQKDRPPTLAPSPPHPSPSALASPSTSSLPPLPPSSALAEAVGRRFRPRVSETATSREAAAMRESYNRTKVVVRHLPPTLPESTFMEGILSRFSGTFNMVSFCPGKSSSKSSIHSRAYIDFKHPEAVINFCQEFNGHVFVNEKGTQYKALVEYAPYQRVPKLWLKRDPREGSIFQDPEYLKFAEHIAKPIDYLPSAEAQLDRKEAERNSSPAGATKDTVVVTPLMEFVRQKRALKAAPQKSTGAGKASARGGASSHTASSKVVLRRGADSRANSMYSSRPRLKEKATYIPRYEENQRRDARLAERKDTSFPDKNGVEQLGVKGAVSVKKNVSGPEKEGLINGVVPMNPGSSTTSGKSGFRNGAIKSPVGSFPGALGEDHSVSNKLSQRMEGGGRSSRGALSRNAVLSAKSDQSSERERYSSRNRAEVSDCRELELDSLHPPTEDKIEIPRHDGRRVRNKDRPDRPVWTLRQRADPGESGKASAAGQSGSPPAGSHRPGRSSRESDGNTVPDSSKPAGKRVGGTLSGYGGHEKQVWVAKPGPGS